MSSKLRHPAKLLYEARWKLHSFAFGTTVALGTVALGGGGCVASGT